MMEPSVFLIRFASVESRRHTGRFRCLNHPRRVLTSPPAELLVVVAGESIAFTAFREVARVWLQRDRLM